MIFQLYRMKIAKPNSYLPPISTQKSGLHEVNYNNCNKNITSKTEEIFKYATATTWTILNTVDVENQFCS